MKKIKLISNKKNGIKITSSYKNLHCLVQSRVLIDTILAIKLIVDGLEMRQTTLLSALSTEEALGVKGLLIGDYMTTIDCELANRTDS